MDVYLSGMNAPAKYEWRDERSTLGVRIRALAPVVRFAGFGGSIVMRSPRHTYVIVDLCCYRQDPS